MPLLLGVGAAALLLGGKKKKKSTAATNGNGKTPKDLEELKYLEIATGPGGDERLTFDEECSEIINKMDMEAHNNWITNRYFQLIGEGMTDLNAVTLQLLKDQSTHCPWDEPDKWTPLMSGLYEQLLGGVQGWHAQTGGQQLPSG